MKDKGNLCTIGKLAEAAGVPRSTINYYCRMGLIKPSGRTEGGFRLFNRKTTARKIKKIKGIIESKITLEDIAGELA